jgi:hypothetical protein
MVHIWLEGVAKQSMLPGGEARALFESNLTGIPAIDVHAINLRVML